MDQSKEFWVIGVGASAGGLEALTLLLKSLPEKPDAAFIVAQHLAPHAKSMMVELLSRHTDLPVIAVNDHLEIKPGVISIVPPNFDVTISNGELRLTKAGNETRPKPSVDVLFTSLARVFGKRAVGIILSGTGSDGSEGIKQIKENGGITIVQKADTAKYDGMPKSAIETGMVDVILPPEKIAEELISILQDSYAQPEPAKELNQEEEIDFNKIVKYLKKEIGTDFTQYKISTVQRRIEKRMSALKKSTLSEYFIHLQSNAEELAALSQNMLVSVTSFFRDTEAYESVSRYLEEIISQKKTGEDLRIWSAGCATGEEPYSLAFIVNDLILKTGKMINLKIFATDLDHEALAFARGGLYTYEDIKNLNREVLEKYFDKKDKFYEVKKIIRDTIVFARQDLIQNPPFVKMDLISCRNVLIYFEAALQSRVFEIFHYALRPMGYLFLGKSESINNNLFDTVDKKEKIFRRVNVVSKFVHGGSYKVGSHFHASLQKRKTIEDTLAESTPMMILKQFGLCGIVIDEESTILHIVGDVSNYISLPAGMADFRLTNLLDKNASIEFTVLLKKASKEDKVFKSRPFRKRPEDLQGYSFSIKAINKNEDDARCLYLVSFEPQHFKIPEERLLFEGDINIPQRLIELEQEVSVTRDNLQTVIEELEVSNEELQSLNEELSSTNEELQASNEELETTNEELQSSNEELMTLNEEMSIKSSELRMAYSSLDNIQSSVNSPLIVLDMNLNILQFNYSTNQIFNLSVSDLGQPILKASCQCEIPDFEELLTTTLQTGKVSEAICETTQRVFQLRVHPSRDENKKIIGAILVFFDNTDVLHAQEKLKSSDKRIRAIIDGSPTLISLKDTQGRYLVVNRSFTEFFGMSEQEILGKTDRELFNDKISAEFRESDLEAILRRTNIEKTESIEFRGKKIHFQTNRFPLFGNNDRNPYAVGTVALDVSTQIGAREELESSEARYRAMIDDQAVLVCRHDGEGNINFVNNSFIKYFDLQKDFTGKFIELLDAKDRKKASVEMSKIDVNHPIVQYETRLESQADKWVRWIHRGIFNDKEVLIEYQIVGFDVTEVHNKTFELLAKESLYTHVLEYTSDYLSVYRYEGGSFYLESFNQSAAYYRGFGSQRLIGRELADLVDPSQSGAIISRFQKTVETNTITNFEEVIQGPGGNLYLSTTIVPIHDAATNVTKVVGLSRDITKLKRTEKALRDEKKNAETANMAKSDFLASMSHELRTPLNVIMGMSQLLQRGKLEPSHMRLVESIQRSGKVLLSLIEDVLDLSKIEAGKISFDSKPFDMDQLTLDVVQSFEAEALKKNISLVRDYRVKPNSPLIGDEVRIKQIMMNLIGNAVKFTEKGQVTFSISLQSKTDDKTTLYFEVKDSGIGIPESAYHKIFNRFSQADSGTSRKFGGTGLGLAISKQLVELMNGTIGFTSEEGQGSTFWFKIELPEAIRDLEEEKYKTIAINFEKFKVLAVDDNPESLKVLKYYFEDKNGNIDFAESGPEAIQKVESHNYDIVLMDMQMPGMDGLEATKRIRQTKKIPIIALTANAMAQDRKKCMDAGMNDFLTKPVDFEALNKILKKWITNEYQ